MADFKARKPAFLFGIGCGVCCLVNQKSPRYKNPPGSLPKTGRLPGGIALVVIADDFKLVQLFRQLNFRISSSETTCSISSSWVIGTEALFSALHDKVQIGIADVIVINVLLVGRRRYSRLSVVDWMRST